MAYSNWGAKVYHNGKRVEENEDCNIPYANRWLYHGVIGDSDVTFGCHKCYFPDIFIHGKEEKKIYESTIDPSNDGDIDVSFMVCDRYCTFTYNEDKQRAKVIMRKGDDIWECTYGIYYGNGWE